MMLEPKLEPSSPRNVRDGHRLDHPAQLSLVTDASRGLLIAAFAPRTVASTSSTWSAFAIARAWSRALRVTQAGEAGAVMVPISLARLRARVDGATPRHCEQHGTSGN